MVDNKRKKVSSQKIQQPGVDSVSKLCSWSACALAIALCLATQHSLTQNVHVCGQNCLYPPLHPHTVNERDG